MLVDIALMADEKAVLRLFETLTRRRQSATLVNYTFFVFSFMHMLSMIVSVPLKASDTNLKLISKRNQHLATLKAC
jgi:hypothetical protein